MEVCGWNKNSYKDTIEIDLGQFLRKLLVQWRAIVVVGIIFGLIAAAYQYVKDVKSYNAAVDSAYNSTPATIEELESALTRDEVNYVYEAVRMQKYVLAEEEYLNNSIYINLDPSNLTKIQLCYEIKPENGASSDDIISCYQIIVNDGSAAEQLRVALGLDVEAKYVSELVSLDRQGENVMVVSLVLGEDMKADAIEKNLNDWVYGLKDKYLVSPHELNKLSTSVATMTDRTLFTDQETEKKGLFDQKRYYYQLVKDLNPTQLQLYNLLIEDDKKSDDVEKEKNVDELVSAISVPSFSKKMFGTGALFGAVLYVLFLFMRSVTSNSITNAEIEKVTDLPPVGLIRLQTNNKNPILKFLLFDGIIYRVVYKDKIKLSKKENIVAHMINNIGEKDCRRFQILQTGFDICANSEWMNLVDVAKMMDVELFAEKIDVSDVKDIVSKLDNSLPVVIGIYANKTKKQDVRELYQILRNQRIDIVGELYIEEVR